VKRSKPLKRTELKRGSTKLPASSAKKRQQLAGEAEVKRMALTRDGGCVMRHLAGHRFGGTTIPPCFGRLEKDEVVSRARGGSPLELANVQILCALHNTWKEDHPELAIALGYARHSWDDTP
jgi:hypothetical protein